MDVTYDMADFVLNVDGVRYSAPEVQTVGDVHQFLILADQQAIALFNQIKDDGLEFKAFNSFADRRAKIIKVETNEQIEGMVTTVHILLKKPPVVITSR